MDIYIMQYNYRSRYLVVINENNYVSVYNFQKYKFQQPFLNYQAQKIFLVNQRIVQ